MPPDIRNDQPVGSQLIEYSGAVVGQGMPTELEILCVIQQTQNFVGRCERPRHPLLPAIGTKRFDQTLMPLWIVCKLRSCRANPQIGNTVEGDWRLSRSRDVKNDKTTIGMFDGLERERDAGLQGIGKPQFQGLVTDLAHLWDEVRSNDIVRGIIDPPYQIAPITLFDTGAIGECRAILANHLWRTIAHLEFQP